VTLSLFHHHTKPHYETLVQEKVLERARRLARLRSLHASDDPLVPICMEVDERGRVTKNCLGVLDLAWQAAEHPEWAQMIQEEVRALPPADNLIWAGMGGSSEDKSMYNAVGLFRGGVRVFLLDSTDPAKLQAILAELTRDGTPLRQALRKTLVVGMAMGMTSYEPVVNLEKLHLLYQKLRIPSQANFLYMTLPDSLLDRFAGPRGYRRVELQPDNDNTTAGRHSGPLTRGSLYPLALNGVDMAAWMKAAVLSNGEAQDALRMAAFLHGNGVEGRDKVCLLLPAEWAGAGIWTKQDFEESLGKSDELGIKIFPGARQPGPDRVFWVLNDAAAAAALRREGHPVAHLRLAGRMALSKYMQWVHHVVFGLGCLRRMNFVTQPGVELYKKIAARLHRKPQREQTRYRATAPGGITLYYDSLIDAGLLTAAELGPPRAGAAEILARALGRLRERKQIEYLELTFYGDTRYRAEGRALAKTLRARGAALGGKLGMLADVYEGPAMNHSYHEMIIGHGRCFSIVMLARRQAAIRSLDYRPDYHKAQWLATKLALAERGRAVVAVTLPSVEAASRRALAAFCGQVARRLRAPPVVR